MKTVASLKTSLDRQEVQEQKRVILEFAHREGITAIEEEQCYGKKRYEKYKDKSDHMRSASFV